MTFLRSFMCGVFLILFLIPGLSKEKYDPTTLVFPPYLHTYGIRKATRFHLFLFSKNRTSFNDTQALAVVRLEAWEDTSTVNDDDEVTVYGVNSGENNIIYNKSMKSLGIYGLDLSEEQRLNQPHGIAANAQGDVYVADTGNNRIVRLFNPSRELKFVSVLDRGEEALKRPFGVTLDIHGHLYVTDTGNNQILEFDAQNKFIRKLGVKGQFLEPTDIEIIHKDDPWSFQQSSYLVIIDSLNQRLQKISLEGQLLSKIRMKQVGYPESDLQYVDLDYYGNIYVTDKVNHCVHKFTSFLRYLTSYGRYGTGDKEFIEPRGIAIYRRFGQVFIGEAMGAQYYWVGVDVFDFKMHYDRERNLVRCDFFLTEPAYLTVDVFDKQDVWVTRVFSKRFLFSCEQEDNWSARIYSLQPAPDEDIVSAASSFYSNLKFIPRGRYTIRYKFEPTYSSYHYFSKEFEQEIEIVDKK